MFSQMNLRQFFNAIVYLMIAFILVPVEKGFAVTANPNPVEYLQPDGTTITILLHGDEFIHWVTTTDGYTIMTNQKGIYEYALIQGDGKMTFSGVQAHNAEIRNAREIDFLENIRPGLFFNEAQLMEMRQMLIASKSPNATLKGGFPTTGTRKLLMILVNFSNTTTTYNQTNFVNYMNQVDYNGTGSFKDYYLEVSYGQLTVNTTVTVWVNLSKTHDYYGPESKWGEFAYDAVVAADAQADINFSDFDNNGDGNVDGVAIIHQGRGQEESGSKMDIWSHSWDLSSAGYSPSERSFDGVYVDAYTTMPEKNGPANMGTIGVMCHEFGHNLGSPDFYDTDNSTGGQYDGTGDWDLMASGSWNGASGTKPAHPNAWIKNYFTWTIPGVLSTAQTILLRNAQVYTDVVRFNSTTANEYFLCENRQQTGFDVGIPGHGLIIYHVDGSYITSHMDGNNINTTSHQGLYPEAANSTVANGIRPSSSSTINTAGCPFPGTLLKTSFSDATTPNSKSWAGANTGYPLSEIAENTTAKEVTFCFISCSSSDDPANFSSTAVSSNQINLAWEKNTANDPVMVAFSLTPTFGTPVNGTNYSAGETITGGGTIIYSGSGKNYNHSGLNPNTIYYYKAWSIMTGTNYSPGVTGNAVTQCNTVADLPFNESFPTTTIPNCWSQVDNKGNGQIWQFGTITNQLPSPALTGNYAYLNSSFYGFGNSQNADLVTPILDLSGYITVKLQFKHFIKARLGSLGSVFYSIDGGTNWKLLQAFNKTSNTNPATFSYVVNAVAGQSQVKFKWNYSGNLDNYWAIDDIQITGASSFTLSVTPSNQSVIQQAGFTTFNVTSNGNWQVSSKMSWCVPTAAGTGNGIIVANYSANPGNTQRVADIVVAITGITPVSVTVTQAPLLATEELSSNGIKIYPNPSNGLFKVVIDEGREIQEIKVINFTGKEILSRNETGEKEFELDLSYVSQGVYIIKIRTDNGLFTRKLVISK
ncbi:MAG: M6 family metalloprotease domain-containing protein [Bacteroidota bacterium]